MGGGEPPVPTKSPETDAGSELYSGGNGQSLNAVGKYGGDYENGSGSGSGNGGMGGERGMASRASESSSIGGSRFIGQYGGNGSESGGNQVSIILIDLVRGGSNLRADVTFLLMNEVGL